VSQRGNTGEARAIDHIAAEDREIRVRIEGAAGGGAYNKGGGDGDAVRPEKVAIEVVIACPLPLRFEMSTQKRTRQQLWEEQYQANSYLHGKPETHLVERFAYLSDNLMSVTEGGQMGFETEPRMINLIMRRMNHVFMEFNSRGGIPVHVRDKIKMPDLARSRSPGGARAFNSRTRKDVPQACKFGKRAWLKPMLEQGVIRFSPASSYSDPSLNAAIRDDELTFTYFPGKASPALKTLPHVAGADWMQQRHPSDYYVQCLATTFSLRLFDDFEADACVIVYDGRELGRRVTAELTKRFHGWIIGGVPITYIDPDNPGEGDIVIPACKHMKYLYQQEQRFICHPRTPISKLDHFTMEIGPLTDIAELIFL
jgi:hypothetical protein